MADHGEVQYTTADGNDYPAHEGAYASFVQLAFVGSIAVICIVLGLAISALTSHWLIGSLVVFVLSPVAFIHGMATGSRTSSLAAFALALLAFGASTLG